VLAYLTDRAATHAWLIPSEPALAGRHLFGPLALWLPSFVHVFAFSLFTAAVLPPQRRLADAACVVWAAVNLLFEIGQHPRLQPLLSELPWAPLARYFRQGVFDPGDIAAALLGALAAALVLRRVPGTREEAHFGR
jgi:hypothetical protein